MLDSTFVETAEFRSLAYTTDFHVAVGRRGAGKSALFKKLQHTYRSNPENILVDGTASEHKSQPTLKSRPQQLTESTR